MLEDPQNPAIRRAYIVRSRETLLLRIAEIGDEDLAGSFQMPTVVMTEILPFEGKLEGFRSLIIERCKAEFILSINEFFPFSDKAHHAQFIGQHASVSEAFDIWWSIEEADTIEIKTDW